jgi:alpha-glucosidase
MSKHTPTLYLVVPLLLGGLVGPASAAGHPTVAVRSPDNRVRVELALESLQGTEAVPVYRVTFRDKPVVRTSRLGVDLVDAPPLGGPCTLEGVQTHSRHDTYTMYPGKRRRVVDHCTEAVVTLRERTPPGRRWELVLRAYDDGVAFRYRFPAQGGWDRLAVAGERTELVLPEETRGYALPLKGFTSSYESRYEKKAIKEIPRDWLLGLPLLLECPGGVWAAVTEANLTDYAGLYLAPAGGQRPALVSRLAPLPGEPKVAVRAALPHASPWRVLLLGTAPGRLVESDLVLNLNEPCALADTSWIGTGKTTFPWWNGYHLEKVPFRPGLNTATMKHYLDFCAEAGIPYHSLDGKDDTAWYGGPIVPYRGADITRGLPGLDLPEVLRYARQKGVRLRLWMHWQAARAHMDRAFPLYRQWGIEGVMIDFMDRDDQEMVNWQRQLLRTAAENRLTVTMHGVAKPTGLERTYPHLLTSEGVLNLEYDKWDPRGCPPEYMVTVPFTRMLAGPLDFHQGCFRGVPVEQFRPRNEAPQVMGTPCLALATYVVYQNHLPMVVDYPSAYRGHPGLAALVQVPTTWDDTRVVAGAVGDYVIIARRRGADWYIGAMNGGKRRDVEAPLGFLGAGRYRAEVYADDLEGSRPYRIAQRSETVTARDVLRVRLESAGGCLVRLTPLPGAGGPP